MWNETRSTNMAPAKLEASNYITSDTIRETPLKEEEVRFDWILHILRAA